MLSEMEMGPGNPLRQPHKFPRGAAVAISGDIHYSWLSPWCLWNGGRTDGWTPRIGRGGSVSTGRQSGTFVRSTSDSGCLTRRDEPPLSQYPEPRSLSALWGDADWEYEADWDDHAVP